MAEQLKYEGHVTVNVRTPAGITHEFRLADEEFVASAMAEAVEYFVDKRELAPGDYGLAVVKDGQIEPLLDTARVGDYHLAPRAELHLVNEAPQVDG